MQQKLSLRNIPVGRGFHEVPSCCPRCCEPERSGSLSFLRAHLDYTHAYHTLQELSPAAGGSKGDKPLLADKTKGRDSGCMENCKDVCVGKNCLAALTADQACLKHMDPSEKGFSKHVDPVDKGFSEHEDPVDKGFSKHVDPVEKGFSKHADPVDKGFSKEEDYLEKGLSKHGRSLEKGFSKHANPMDKGFSKQGDSVDQGFSEFADPVDKGFSKQVDPVDKGFSKHVDAMDSRFLKHADPTDKEFSKHSAVATDKGLSKDTKGVVTVVGRLPAGGEGEDRVVAGFGGPCVRRRLEQMLSTSDSTVERRLLRVSTELARADSELQRQRAHSEHLAQAKRELHERERVLNRQVDSAVTVIATLRRQLSASEQELERKEREAMTIHSFLDAAVQHEICGKVRLQNFIENLLQRISLAERLLKYYQNASCRPNCGAYCMPRTFENGPLRITHSRSAGGAPDSDDPTEREPYDRKGRLFPKSPRESQGHSPDRKGERRRHHGLLAHYEA